MKEITIPFHLICYTLLASLISYLPYEAIVPGWLFLFIALALIYRATTAYYSIALPSKIIQFALIPMLFLLLKMHYGTIISSNFYIGFLLAFVGLKITELNNERDLKVLILCNFYLVFSILILVQELWVITYLLIALFANISLMLKVTAPQASLIQIGTITFKQIIMAIPLSIVLFYIFPRIAVPLWQVPAQSQARIGFIDKMNPGSITQLFKDESTAFQVTFKNSPLLNAYWRGLSLNFYNGVSWSSLGNGIDLFSPLLPLASNSLADYEVMLEAQEQKWLFYTDYPFASSPKLLFSPTYGLVNESASPIARRFAYAIKLQKKPYHSLSQNEWQKNTQLPKAFNPQLRLWAQYQYTTLNHDPQAFISFLKNYIHQQGYWYTLSPQTLKPPHQMDDFWFSTQKGFCEHYASAVTIILRSVNIPARVVVGYQGGEWNPIGRYLTVQQSDAHAWLEYWQDGLGWQQFDPTSFIAPERIDQSILDKQNNYLSQTDSFISDHLGWLQQTKLLLESAQFFAERWLLFYDQETQHKILANLGLTQWDASELVQTAVASIILFLIMMGLLYQWQQSRREDPLLTQYHLLQREFKRFKVATSSSATLHQQCQSLIKSAPKLAGQVTLFLSRYERLRLKRTNELSKENKKQTQQLFKDFRLKLKRLKPDKNSKSDRV